MKSFYRPKDYRPKKAFLVEDKCLCGKPHMRLYGDMCEECKKKRDEVRNMASKRKLTGIDIAPKTRNFGEASPIVKKKKKKK